MRHRSIEQVVDEFDRAVFGVDARQHALREATDGGEDELGIEIRRAVRIPCPPQMVSNDRDERARGRMGLLGGEAPADDRRRIERSEHDRLIPAPLVERKQFGSAQATSAQATSARPGPEPTRRPVVRSGGAGIEVVPGERAVDRTDGCGTDEVADKGYPSKKNRAWMRERKIAATIPERDDQIAHRRKRPGRPIDFGDEQQERYKGRNVVERCFNKLEQWRGSAMRSDKTARAYRAAIALAATLIRIETELNHAG